MCVCIYIQTHTCTYIYTYKYMRLILSSEIFLSYMPKDLAWGLTFTVFICVLSMLVAISRQFCYLKDEMNIHPYYTLPGEHRVCRCEPRPES